MHEEDVALSFLPLSHAFERMVCYVYLLRGVTMIFAESLETIGRDVPRREADGVHRRAARLREDARADLADRAVRVAGEERDLPLGRQRRHGARPGAAVGAAPGAAPGAAVGPRRPPGVLEDPQRRRRPSPLPGVGQRAARRRRGGVLSRPRPADHRGLRPHRDRADPHRQSAATPRASARSEGGLPASSCASPPTARFWRAART